jgi:choline dehydrogenase-like flavoprotein
MHRDRFDVVIIGSGAGGGTVAHALSETPARVLLLERGDFIPQEDENADPEAVWRDLRYRSDERWRDQHSNEFRPYMHYCVGGNTKFWGCVLYRFRREDFHAVEHADGLSPAWPIDYDTLEPYYDRAERLYHVHGEAGVDPTEPPRGPFPYPAVPHGERIAEIAEQLRGFGLHPSPLPLGLIEPGAPAGCILCNTCNSFPCRHLAKGEADVCCVRPAAQRPNVTLWTGAFARRLLTDPSGARIESVEVDHQGDTRRVEAPLFVVSCGAVNSAALLLRSASDKHPGGLGNSSGLLGRRYMAHLATMMQGFHPFRPHDTAFQKTLAINDYYLAKGVAAYPLGHIQTQGRTHGIMAKMVGDSDPKYHLLRDIPVWVYDAWVARGVDWLAMSEDLPHEENRVTVDADGRIRLSYEPNNLVAHDRLVTEVKQILRRLGFWKVMAHSHHHQNTTHQCGTMCFGTDPRSSVLDPFCRSHDIPNLFVVDASFFPSSGAVNPALTIVAQALRTADHIVETELS